MLQQRALIAFATFGAAAVAYAWASVWQRVEQRRSAMPLLLCLACVGAGASFYLPFTNDDAFIFFRYARNLLDGTGLVYNRGDMVEGFTSPAWLLFIAAAGALGCDLLWAAKLSGIVLTAAAVGLCFSVATRIAGRTAGLACGLALACSQLLLSWAGSGMDVALFVCFECLLLALFLEDAVSGRALALTVVGVFIRPEAYVFLGCYWGWQLWRSWRRGTFAGTAPYALGAVLAALLPFLLRWLYYGRLLPNTYYAKSMLTLADGLDYVTALARYLSWPLCTIAAIGAALSLRSRPWVAIGLSAALTLLVAIGGDMLSLRLGLFVVPWLIVAVAVALESLPTFTRALVAAGIAAVLVARSIFEMHAALPEFHSQVGPLYVINNARGTLEADYAAGQYLAAHAAGADWLLTDNIGAVGYASGLPILDTYGLVTSQVSALVAHGQADHVRDLVRRADAPWILCYYRRDAEGERWGLWGGGDITDWARERYEPVQHWAASTGYRRVLLQRRAR